MYLWLNCFIYIRVMNSSHAAISKSLNWKACICSRLQLLATCRLSFSTVFTRFGQKRQTDWQLPTCGPRPTTLQRQCRLVADFSLSFSPCVRFEFDFAAVGKQFFDWIICQVLFASCCCLWLWLLLINVTIIAIANRKFA